MLIWICSKLENTLLYNWTTPYRTVSISTTWWRKFSHFRFAKFCSVLKSIRGDGSFGLGNLLMTSLSVNIGMCPESQISSENSNFGLYHPNNPWWYPFQEMIFRNHHALYISGKKPRAESVLIRICSKLENILFYNWTTPYRTVSTSTTCWRKFAKFCSVLNSIREDGSLGLGNLLMTSLSLSKWLWRRANARNVTFLNLSRR